MKDKKLIVPILFGVLLVIYLILNSITNKVVEDSRVKELTNEEVYFTIENTINSDNADELSEANYTIKKGYYITHGLYDVYFLNGYTIENNIAEKFIYNDNINYIFILKGLTYKFERINTNDVYEYAKNFNVEDISLTTDSILPSLNFTEKIKLESYIARFTNLLLTDRKEAFDFLSDDEKERYSNETNLINQKDSILNKLSPAIDTYSKEEGKKYNTYHITDYLNNKITIIEYSVTDYKIDFN